MRNTGDSTTAFEKAASAHSATVELKLYIAGMGPRSTRAVADIEALRQHYGNRCNVEIVDIYEQPEAAKDAQIIAVPALVRDAPLPVRKIIGVVGDIDVASARLGIAHLMPGRPT